MVKHIPCGPFVTHSEKVAFEATRQLLNTRAGHYVLLTNVNFSVRPEALPEELDLLVVGPDGLWVVEVKHWDKAYIADNAAKVEHEAVKLNEKVKRITGHLRKRTQANVPFLTGRLLLTRAPAERFAFPGGRDQIRGIPLYGVSELATLFDDGTRSGYGPADVEVLVRALETHSAPSLGLDLAHFPPFRDLRLKTRDGFRSVYDAQRMPEDASVVLHLYDLSASDAEEAYEVARREFDVIQRLQKADWLPRLRDSFQDAPEYPGEFFFFSYDAPTEPTLAERGQDDAWPATERVRFAAGCADALAALHGAEDGGEHYLHRNLTPTSIRVSAAQTPLLTELHLARSAGERTVAHSYAPPGGDWVAPEIREGGWQASSTWSDVFSLCASLAPLFPPAGVEPLALRAAETLAQGTRQDPASRPSSHELAVKLRKCLEPDAESCPKPDTVPSRPVAEAEQHAETAQDSMEDEMAPPVDTWTVGTLRPFQGRTYRVVERLGGGGFGHTFKVVEVNEADRTISHGFYVAKVVTPSAKAGDALRAYARVRAVTRSPHLAGVLEVAPRWAQDEIAALLHWVEGEPLGALRGRVGPPATLVAPGQSVRILTEHDLLRWLRDLCQGMSEMHRGGLVHGDVSPRNIIVHGQTVVLTDYDTTAEVGKFPAGCNPVYCAHASAHDAPAAPSDDVFALAATFFRVCFDRSPFGFSDGPSKTRGLNWGPGDRDKWPSLVPFLDHATAPSGGERFRSAEDALPFLDGAILALTTTDRPSLVSRTAATQRSPLQQETTSHNSGAPTAVRQSAHPPSPVAPPPIAPSPKRKSEERGARRRKAGTLSGTARPGSESSGTRQGMSTAAGASSTASIPPVLTGNANPNPPARWTAGKALATLVVAALAVTSAQSLLRHAHDPALKGGSGEAPRMSVVPAPPAARLKSFAPSTANVLERTTTRAARNPAAGRQDSTPASTRMADTRPASTRMSDTRPVVPALPSARLKSPAPSTANVLERTTTRAARNPAAGRQDTRPASTGMADTRPSDPAIAPPSDDYRKARERFSLHDHAGAARFARRAVAREPGNEEALKLLGACYGLDGDLPRAAAMYRRASQTAPADMEARLGLALALEASGQRAQARAAYHYIVEDSHSTDRQVTQATERLRATKD